MPTSELWLPNQIAPLRVRWLAIFSRPERALRHLGLSPCGSLVGIETLDDVAVLFANGRQMREQDKHYLSGKVAGHFVCDVTQPDAFFFETGDDDCLMIKGDKSVPRGLSLLIHCTHSR